MSSLTSKVLEFVDSRWWGKKFGYDIPPDTPICGFFNENCPPEGSGVNVVVIVAVIASLILVGAGSAVIYVLYRLISRCIMKLLFI